jgi:hypothetical protein
MFNPYGVDGCDLRNIVAALRIMIADIGQIYIAQGQTLRSAPTKSVRCVIQPILKIL